MFDPNRSLGNDCFRPKADHGHAANTPVMCAQVMSFFLLVPCRVSGATLKLNRELRMHKERYQTQSAENITPLVSSNNRYTQEDVV